MVERLKLFVQLRHYRARKLRKKQTSAEEKLWIYLRNRELAGVKFRRQHAVGGFIVDFYSLEAKLVVELDGFHHADVEIARYDQQRTEYLEGRGLKVLRFWNYEVMNELEAVLELILLEVKKRVPHLP